MSKAKEFLSENKIAEAKDESKKVKDWKEVMEILDAEGVSRSPAYTGWGVEIYEDKKKQIQIVYNQRGSKNEVMIHRGFLCLV